MSQAYSALLPSGETNYPNIWRNGEIIPWESASIHVTAVGHASVSSVFEGIKGYYNAEQDQLYVFRLREHMKRFVDSVRLVSHSMPFGLEELERGILDLLRANDVREDVYIRPWMFAKDSGRRVMVPAGTEAEVVIDMWPFTSHLLTATGSRVCVSSWTRLADNQMAPRIKAFSNYHNGRMAILEAERNGYDTAIMLNEQMKVAEGPGACLGMIRGGVFHTPTVTSGILESITRDAFITLVPEVLGIPVKERDMDRTELYLAEELFFMGTGREISPIIEVDGFKVGKGEPGPHSRKLAVAYNALVRGTDDGYPEWRTPVHT